MPDNVPIQGIEFEIKGGASEALKGLKDLSSSLRDLQRIAKSSSGIKSAAKEVKNFGNTVSGLRSGKGMSNLSYMFESIKIGTGGIAKGIKSATKQTVGFAKSIASTPINKFSRAAKSAVGSVNKFTSSIGRILMYRAIRTVLKEIAAGVKEGINNLYQYSRIVGTEFHGALDGLASDALYVKNSFATIAAPIVQAVKPAFDAIANAIGRASARLAEFMAAFTGRSVFSRAVKGATDYADAVSGAAKATKSFLLGIDELNVFDDSSGSGGGKTQDDFASMFEEAAVTSPVADFAKAIKDAIRVGDWQSAGEMLAEKVNSVFDKIPWAGIGQKAGRGIGGFISTLYYFLENVDFRGFGNRVATLINNALGNINFTDAGRLAVRKLTAWFDTLIGTVEKLNWRQIGKSIGDYLRGALNEFSDWSKTVNWYEFTKNLWSDVKSFIEGIDFASLANSFFAFLGSAFGAALSVIGTFFVGVWEGVSAYFSEKTREAGGDTWEGFKKGVKEAWTSVRDWLKQNIVDPFVNGFKELLGIHSPSTVMAELGGYTVEGFWNGFTAKWTEFIAAIRGKWNAFKEWWSKLELPAFKIKTPHLSWTSTPASGWIADVLSALGLPTSIPKLNVSWYAKGGIVDGATLIGAGEAGKEAIIPLERNTEWIDKVADRLAQRDESDDEVVRVLTLLLETAREISANGRNSGINVNSLAREITTAQRMQARASGAY